MTVEGGGKEAQKKGRAAAAMGGMTGEKRKILLAATPDTCLTCFKC